MFPESAFIFLLMLGLLAWFWQDSMRARERAIRIGKQVCEKEGLQLLDDTVALNSLRLKRDGDGRLGWWRRYAFEFSDDGNNRRAGAITLMGLRLDAIQLDPYLMQ
jgi:hypothetical protein